MDMRGRCGKYVRHAFIIPRIERAVGGAGLPDQYARQAVSRKDGGRPAQDLRVRRLALVAARIHADDDKTFFQTLRPDPVTPGVDPALLRPEKGPDRIA